MYASELVDGICCFRVVDVASKRLPTEITQKAPARTRSRVYFIVLVAHMWRTIHNYLPCQLISNIERLASSWACLPAACQVHANISAQKIPTPNPSCCVTAQS